MDRKVISYYTHTRPSGKPIFRSFKAYKAVLVFVGILLIVWTMDVYRHGNRENWLTVLAGLTCVLTVLSNLFIRSTVLSAVVVAPVPPMLFVIADSLQRGYVYSTSLPLVVLLGTIAFIIALVIGFGSLSIMWIAIKFRVLDP